MIRICDLTVSYANGHLRGRRDTVLNGITLNIEQGETLALIGESGSGKSTLSKAILRLIPCISGNVYLNDVDLTKLGNHALRKYRKDMQIIFQNPETALNPRMRIYDCVAEMLRIHRLCQPHSEGERTRVGALIASVGLGEEHLHRYPHELSGGQVQRVCIARALSVRPKFLIADEPTSMLDASAQAHVLALLLKAQKENGHACLFISHDLDVVRIMSDRVAVLHQGALVETGQMEQILSDPRQEYTKALIQRFLQGREEV
jgi:ABC-type glutathione transport system ATPase component